MSLMRIQKLFSNGSDKGEGAGRAQRWHCRGAYLESR